MAAVSDLQREKVLPKLVQLLPRRLHQRVPVVLARPQRLLDQLEVRQRVPLHDLEQARRHLLN